MRTDCFQQLTLFPVDQQQVTVDFQGGQVVSDAGLLSLRAFEKKLGILSGLAERLLDPRCQELVTYPLETLLTQRVYQILADYPDANDAQTLRHDPLFQTVADVAPCDEATLASGSTLNRFHYAYTRRQANLPPEERPVLLEQQDALNQRLKIVNDYLVELYIRTRRQVPDCVTIDLDATDDPTHGQQYLSFYHGYYEQHQYYPLLAFDGDSGMPLATWLRPGTAHASWGAVETLEQIVTLLRRAWPTVKIQVRGDSGFAVPEMYEYCETHDVGYVLGYSSNNVLLSKTETALHDLELYHQFYGHREPAVQRFERFEDYQADSWSRPRSIVAKIEITPSGNNRRFVVTNLAGSPRQIYHDFYVQRGDVPEKPINELKNMLHADRLSQSGFRANAMRLMEHTLAYAIVVLYREAASATVPQVGRAEVSTLRQMLWKVGAVVQTSVRRIWFHFSSTWLYRDLWVRVHETVMAYAETLSTRRPVLPTSSPQLLS